MKQLLIKNGKCITPSGIIESDLLSDEGCIVAIRPNIIANARQEIDAQGRYIMPGGIDVHVHLPWPTGDFISLDTFETGTRAAAFGGTTTVIDFAIPTLEQDLNEALDDKLHTAEDKSWVDYSLHLTLRGKVSDQLREIPELITRGFPSFKAFMAYEGFRLADAELLQLMQVVAENGGMVDVHAENGPLADFITHTLLQQGRTAPENYVHARPSVCEEEAISRLLIYERLTRTNLHIHHVSTVVGAKLIGSIRDEGFPVSGETCPQYLTLDNTMFSRSPEYAASMVCAPSIKSSTDQEALWQALAEDDLSVIATDHCPYSRNQKLMHLDNFSRIPGGIAGVETRLFLMLTAGVLTGRLSMERFAEVWATSPARIFGLYPRKGALMEGSDADLVIFDLASSSQLHFAELHMNSDILPFEGWEVAGTPLTTVLRGEILIADGRQVMEKSTGKLIPRFLNHT